MKSRALLFLTLAGLVVFPGCEDSSITPVATEPDIVTVKLAQAADKAATALDSIAGIEQQRNPSTPPLEDYSNAPASLMQPVSIRWTGGIELVARTLAERAGYRFHVKGRVPPVPLTVSVDSYQKPILHVLRDIGLQAGHRADIAIDGANGVIELRYAPADLPESHYASEIK